MGIETVLVVSTADRDSLPARMADRAICIGAAPASQSYLNVQAIMMAAHSLAGVKGMLMGGAPTCRNASVTALAKAGNEPEQPDSPTPLDPNKLSAVCTAWVSW